LGRVIFRATLLFGTGLVAFSLSHVLWVSMLCLVVAGFGMMVQMASSNTVIQTIVDDTKRGRVMSFYTMCFLGTAPFGSLLAGALSTRIGAPQTVMACGGCCAAAALWFHRELPEIRSVVRPIYARLGILPEVASGIQSASQLMTPPEQE
jgi:MFS family permease